LIEIGAKERHDVAAQVSRLTESLHIRILTRGQTSRSSHEARDRAKSEVSAIDTPIKPKVNVQESIENAKAYCKQNPASFVSLRDYSGGVYNQTCSDFAAEQHATDPTYTIGSD
jgi:hypothetical protein